MYNNYHGEQYFKVRHSYEFYYTRTFHDAFENSEDVIHRKARFLELLNRNNIANRISSVIDWGGDRGQFIPESIPERYVYEISNFEPVSGVTKVANKQEAMSRSFDMVMLCHVLEHCSDPCNMIQQLTELDVKFFYFRPRKWTQQHQLQALVLQHIAEQLDI